MPVKLIESLALKQVKHALLAALALGFLMSVIQIFTDYQREQETIFGTVNQVLRTAEESAATAAFRYDEALANRVIDGLFKYEPIYSVTISDDFGNDLAFSERALVEESLLSRFAVTFVGKDKVFSVPLMAPKRRALVKEEKVIGTLSVRLDPSVVSQGFMKRSSIIIVTGLVRNLMLSIILTVIFFGTLTKPLISLTGTISRLKIDDENAPQIIIPDKNKHDEIGYLAKTTNGILARLSTALRERKQAEMSLKKSHQELEQRVAERTTELLTEVAERKQAEQTLASREAQFRDFAESSSDIFWESGPDRRFTFFSAGHALDKQLPSAIMVGKKDLDLVDPEELARDPEKWQAYEAIIAAFETFSNLEFHFNPNLSSIEYLSLNGKAFFDEAGQFMGYRGTGRDISNRYRREMERQVALDAADDANRAKSTFLSSMSHELRTPLNSILGFAQLLGAGKKEPPTEKQKVYIQKIINGGEHLLDLINEVLDLSKIEAGQLSLSFEVIHSKILIHDCFSYAQVLAGKRDITLEDQTGEDLPDLWADHLRARQVVLNLLSNAIKYNHDGGEVWVTAERRDNDYLRLSVCDNGIGIPKQKHGELFQPFHRLGAETTATEGTGIGLVITKRILEEMKGSIGFESHEGEGSCFWLDLPIASSKEARSTRHEQFPTSNMALNSEERLMLYIEDNPANLTLMEGIIGEIPNLRLISTHTAELGLALAEQHNPDVILLDINLPGMDGFQAVRQLFEGERTRHIPVIALSANAMPHDIRRGEEAGFRAYLTKPLNISQLIATLRDVLPE